MAGLSSYFFYAIMQLNRLPAINSRQAIKRHKNNTAGKIRAGACRLGILDRYGSAPRGKYGLAVHAKCERRYNRIYVLIWLNEEGCVNFHPINFIAFPPKSKLILSI